MCVVHRAAQQLKPDRRQHAHAYVVHGRRPPVHAIPVDAGAVGGEGTLELAQDLVRSIVEVNMATGSTAQRYIERQRPAKPRVTPRSLCGSPEEHGSYQLRPGRLAGRSLTLGRRGQHKAARSLVAKLEEVGRVSGASLLQPRGAAAGSIADVEPLVGQLLTARVGS